MTEPFPLEDQTRHDHDVAPVELRISAVKVVLNMAAKKYGYYQVAALMPDDTIDLVDAEAVYFYHSILSSVGYSCNANQVSKWLKKKGLKIPKR